jgi:hypothetical protein
MRRLGLTVAMTLLLFLSGCEIAVLEPEKGRHDIEVRNDDTESHRVTLEVVDGDGDTVQKGSQVVAPGGTWDANRIAHAGEYTIRVSTAEGDETYVDTVELPIEGEDTVSVSVVRINRDGSISGEVTVREPIDERLAELRER